MRSAHIVLGCGYGDEGKGLATDYLSGQISNDPTIVIRFNGGHQAGHTVQTDNVRHVFSSFGSGTLQGLPTYWSANCTFQPHAALLEYQDLEQKRKPVQGTTNLFERPSLFVDPDCPVTTPFDVWFNQATERARDNGRHGSVGVGFGTTIERHTTTPYRLLVRDLEYPTILRQKLHAIAAYYWQKAEQQSRIFQSMYWEYVQSPDEVLEQFIDAAQTGFYGIRDLQYVNHNYQTGIFEGAQGILLDEEYGFFPHVTRSKTTMKNIAAMRNQTQLRAAETHLWYVTRAYHTRHGNGPLFGETRLEEMGLRNTETETNQQHLYQGKFRYAPLHWESFRYAIRSNERDTLPMYGNRNLLVTCMDQITENPFKGKESLLQNLGINQLYINGSPDSKTVEHLVHFST